MRAKEIIKFWLGREADADVDRYAGGKRVIKGRRWEVRTRR